MHQGSRRRLLRTLRTAFAAALLATPLFSFAQEYPNRPITLVVPFAPGGGTDSIAREIAQGMAEKLGKGVIVDNRGGAGGSIGARQVAKADPDGYTLLFVTSTFVTHAATEAKSSYDIGKDYAPIAMIGRGPLMVVTHKKVGARNLQQLVAVSKARPEGLTFCSAGAGSINHMSGELFKQKTGANMTHVPYKGSGPATLDLIAGRTDLFFATVPTILSHVKSGSVELLAVTGPKRLAFYPDVPTAMEAGIKDFNITTWWGMVAPAGTPEPIIAKLNAVINELAARESMKARLVNEGAEAYRTTPEQFKTILAQELAMWKGVARAANLKLD
jgi:tripartite-type tricarboxylate transporter receptor subunit TctC